MCRYKFADKGEQLDKLWEARRGCYIAAMSYRDLKGDRVYLSDTCVPLSNLAQMVSETEADFQVRASTIWSFYVKWHYLACWGLSIKPSSCVGCRVPMHNMRAHRRWQLPLLHSVPAIAAVKSETN